MVCVGHHRAFTLDVVFFLLYTVTMFLMEKFSIKGIAPLYKTQVSTTKKLCHPPFLKGGRGVLFPGAIVFKRGLPLQRPVMQIRFLCSAGGVWRN